MTVQITTPQIATLFQEVLTILSTGLCIDPHQLQHFQKHPFQFNDIELSEDRPMYGLHGGSWMDDIAVEATVYTTVMSSKIEHRRFTSNFQIDDAKQARMARDLASALKRHFLPDKTARADYVVLKGGSVEHAADHSVTAFAAELQAFIHCIATGSPWKLIVNLAEEEPKIAFHFDVIGYIKNNTMKTRVNRYMIATIRERASA